MPTMLKMKMPTIKPLTNQELLTELERRIKAGTIKLEIDTAQVEPQAKETSNSFGVSKSSLILGLGVVAVLAFYFSSSKTTLPVQIQTSVKINEAL